MSSVLSVLDADTTVCPPTPTRPVAITIDAPDLVRAGLQSLLLPYATQVVVQPPTPRLRPDVAVVDVGFGGTDASYVGVPVVALVGAGDVAALVRARHLGATESLPLSTGAAHVVHAVERAHTGTPPPGSPAPSELLSVREREVLRLVCLGLTNDEVAAELFVSINTLKTHIRSVYRKIGANRRSQAILWGTAHQV